MKSLLMYTIVVLLSFLTKSQTRDTVIKGTKFNVIETYGKRKLKILGQKDSLPNGKWIYFKRNGDTLAFGNYEKGRKIGPWTYYDYKKRKSVIEFYFGSWPISTVRKRFGRLIIIDRYRSASHCRSVLKNGQEIKKLCW